jgi:hypothetical protein
MMMAAALVTACVVHRVSQLYLLLPPTTARSTKVFHVGAIRYDRRVTAMTRKTRAKIPLQPAATQATYLAYLLKLAMTDPTSAHADVAAHCHCRALAVTVVVCRLALSPMVLPLRHQALC